ncbi:MAG: hypothetical protein HOA15_06855 [Candidatus Marinimicrobia bacterium]|jgi:hypothetical protein|nr:hypothetical protein [Candidatus Neomarinimicrobiota bacterium]MBT3676717.1 hypothetical protein [Candidatus Neomarinimicrobiota bacterium]MBT3764181.1 hypothetical protein [Candidatus Neomarinimicrobiota bacterium]MBT4068510.1 hypothetical protein [Candidatus Neomarinimicrobiota bacterium]MBT4271448.1 hypothetical protein [Candidatus Neomarinimicrobiota bacterium]
MSNIALFVKDFQKGTELSERLTAIDMEVTFTESIYDLPDQCRIGIVDLDDEKFGNVQFVSKLNSKTGMTLLGYMNKVHKETRDKLKAAGCDLVISKASIVTNIQSLVKELTK